MKFRVVCLSIVASCALLSQGFVCSTRVEKMEADIAALQLQFGEIQKRVNNDQTQLTEMILRADKKLEELNNTQGKTHDQVAQQNVQLAIELEKERAELADMRGRIDVQQKTISDLQTALQTLMGSVAGTTGGSGIILPSDQEALFNFIEEKKAAGDSASQRAGIQEFVRRYPKDPRVEPILAELVSLYGAEKSDRDSIAYAAQYLQLFPNGANRNEVIYVMGEAGLRIGNCDLAQKSFMTLQSLSYRDAGSRLKEAKNCK